MENQGEVREDWRTKVMPLDHMEAKVSEDRGGAEAESEGMMTMAKLDEWRIPVEPKEWRVQAQPQGQKSEVEPGRKESKEDFHSKDHS